MNPCYKLRQSSIVIDGVCGIVVGMHESEPGLNNYQYNPEVSQTNEIVCRPLNRLFMSIHSARSYDSLLMALNTYIEQEYDAEDVSIDALYGEVMMHPQFPTESLYDADRELANQCALMVVYEYFGKLYEDSHPHTDTNIWMIRLFREMAKAAPDNPGESLAARVSDHLSFSATTFDATIEQDNYIFINETYVKIKRRMRLAHLDGLLTDDQARQLYRQIDTAFVGYRGFGVDTKLVRSPLVEELC